MSFIMDRQKLVEIKKGQTGTGLLIENDGYISLDSKENKMLKESIDDFKNGEANALPRPFIVHAVFQKYGIENANGRIYPENILKREVEKYQAAINERRAYGECYTPDVLCLTEKGWVTLKDVNIGDTVLTLNVETNEIESKKVINKIVNQHSGDMIRIKGRLINDLVTENHMFPIFGRNGKFKGYYSAKDMLENNIPDMSHSSILKTGNWNICSNYTFTIPAINPSKRVLSLYPNSNEDLELNTDSFMKFMGIYLSEGHCKKNGYSVIITQKKENICLLIEELLTELPFKYSIYERKNGVKDYCIKEPRLYSYLNKLGDCYTKYIPLEIKKQSKEHLRLLYEWFVLGDGRQRGDKRHNRKLTDDVFSVSKQLVLDLNEIQFKIGYNGSYHIEERDNNRLIEGRLIKSENTHKMYFSLRSLSKNVWLDNRFISISKEEYNGEVMCIDVEDNHNWFVMSDGKTHWTGNCNHPEASSIDLRSICMNITSLKWVGHTLVGDLEIPISEGFRRYGIGWTLADVVAQWLVSGLKIGVSSRGLGTVSQMGGKVVVNDDYEIVCWDVVSQPSTPNAWIDMEAEKLRPYIQEQVTDDNKKIIKEDRFSKFDSWLNG